MKDEITPYVDSMKVGVKLPADVDIKALREEHINVKSGLEDLKAGRTQSFDDFIKELESDAV